MLYRHKFLIIAFLFIGLHTNAQVLTINNFKLLVDDYAAPDSTNTIKLTKEQLLSLKELHTNYGWATIKANTFYIAGCGASDVIAVTVNGNNFRNVMKNLFEKCAKLSTISIVPKVVNKQNKPVEWGILKIVVL